MNNTCSLCHAKFSIQRNLKRHMIKVHKISSEHQTYEDKSKLYKCSECSCSYGIIQDLIYHLENTHGVPIEREELTFESFADFSNWKQHIEQTECCTYIPFGGKAKTDGGSGVVKYVCNQTGIFCEEGINQKYRQDKRKGSCISNIQAVEDPDGDLYVARIKTHYGHDRSQLKKPNIKKSENQVRNKIIAPNETDTSEMMDDDSENEPNDALKEDIKVKFDAVLSSLDKFDNKKLLKLNTVLHNICTELDLVNESTNNEVIGTIIISSNSSLDHSYI